MASIFGLIVGQSVALVFFASLAILSYVMGDLQLSIKRLFARKFENTYNVRIIGNDSKEITHLVKSDGNVLRVKDVPYRIEKSFVRNVRGAPTYEYSLGNPMPIDPHNRGYFQINPEYFGDVMVQIENMGRADMIQEEQRHQKIMFIGILVAAGFSVMTFLVSAGLPALLAK